MQTHRWGGPLKNVVADLHVPSAEGLYWVTGKFPGDALAVVRKIGGFKKVFILTTVEIDPAMVRQFHAPVPNKELCDEFQKLREELARKGAVVSGRHDAENGERDNELSRDNAREGSGPDVGGAVEKP
jgi:hypothetical protein